MASFITNMTLFLLLMNMSGGFIAETGTFEVRRTDLTEAECTSYSGSWLAGRGGNGFCTLSTLMEEQYENDLDNSVRESVCVNPEDDLDECVPRTFQDEGVSGVADTVFKTLGDLSFGIGVVAKIFSAAIVSPLGWISNAAFQCSTIADVNSHCSAQEVQDATRWTSIITIIQIPIYLMYGLFLIQLVTNRRIL